MGSAYVTGALIETRAPNWVVTVTSALHMRHFFHWAPQIFITWGEFRKGLDNQRKQKNVISEKIFSVLPLLNYCNYNGRLISASSFYPSCCYLNSSQLLEKKNFEIYKFYKEIGKIFPWSKMKIRCYLAELVTNFAAWFGTLHVQLSRIAIMTLFFHHSCLYFF